MAEEIDTNPINCMSNNLLVGVTRLEGFFAGAKSQVLNPY